MVCDAFTTDPLPGTGFIGAIAFIEVFFLVTIHVAISFLCVSTLAETIPDDSALGQILLDKMFNL